MFKDAFAEVGANYDEQVISLDLWNMSTQDAMKKVAEAISSIQK
jgi:hypothetical protein